MISVRPFLPVIASFTLLACDKPATETPKEGGAVAEPMTSAGKTAPPPAATTPSKPSIAVSSAGWSVGGDRIEANAPDPKVSIAQLLANKPVSGEEITVDAPRDTYARKVAPALGALAAAKAKSARIRTPKRDGTTAEIVFPLDAKPTDCAAVGTIGDNIAINAWTVAGGTATRFAKGMAGPDLTLGSAGVRKVADKCESQSFVVGAEDKVSWGLLVDLILAVQHPEDAGAPKAITPILVVPSPVPGRKVNVE